MNAIRLEAEELFALGDHLSKEPSKAILKSPNTNSTFGYLDNHHNHVQTDTTLPS